MNLKDSSENSLFVFKNDEIFYQKLNLQSEKTSVISSDKIVTINVSGMRYQTLDDTLKRFPNSLLGDPLKRQKYWNSIANEYFLDRHRTR